MKYPFYKGEGKRNLETSDLPIINRDQMFDPSKYLADEKLVDACNVALLLSQPLLITGEPGSGKTEFASSLAWELKLDQPLKFETKSNSEAQDLFYTYDALSRFEDANVNATKQLIEYISYGPLGKAILMSNAPEKVALFTGSRFSHKIAKRSVVLIDEIDKASRDFPNDILNELERFYFRIKEIGDGRIEANPDLSPIVILTSNSEKGLPDAFLRRCVFCHINFPEREKLKEILASRLRLSSHTKESPFIQSALDLFERLRGSELGLRKCPSTSELLAWIHALQKLPNSGENPLESPRAARSTMGILIKSTDDLKLAESAVDAWIRDRENAPSSTAQR